MKDYENESMQQNNGTSGLDRSVGSLDNTVERIYSSLEKLFRRHGWISGIFVFLYGLYRFAVVLFACLTTVSTVSSYPISGGTPASVTAIYIFQAATGIAIMIGGIIMTVKLKKWCKKNSEK